MCERLQNEVQYQQRSKDGDEGFAFDNARSGKALAGFIYHPVIQQNCVVGYLPLQ